MSLSGCGRVQLQLQYVQTTFPKVWGYFAGGLIAEQTGFQKLVEQTAENAGVGYFLHC